MAIDLRFEQLLSFKQATKRPGGPTNLSTLHRWRQRGIRGVKLETILYGGRRLTSVEALERFALAVTAAREQQSPVASTPSVNALRAATALRAEGL